MKADQLRLLRKAHGEAKSLVQDLEHAEAADMLVASAKFIERMLGYVLAKEPTMPKDGHVKKPGGGIIYTLDEMQS